MYLIKQNGKEIYKNADKHIALGYLENIRLKIYGLNGTCAMDMREPYFIAVKNGVETVFSMEIEE